MKTCLLRENEPCIHCGECDLCDLDETKVCDNCCKCLETDAEYNEITVDQILEKENSTH